MFWSFDRVDERVEAVANTVIGTSLPEPAGGGWVQVESPVHYPGDGEPAQFRQWYKRTIDAPTGRCDLKKVT